MRSALVLLVALLLTGCATLPAPSAQVRLSQLEGQVEGGAALAGGALAGRGCVLSVLGELPAGLELVLEQGPCRVSTAAPGARPP